MNASGKTFLFLFGTVFLAIVLASLTSAHFKNKIEAAKAIANQNAAAEAAGVTA